MLSTFSHKRVWMLVVAAGIAALAVACAAEEAAEPATQPTPHAPGRHLPGAPPPPRR